VNHFQRQPSASVRASNRFTVLQVSQHHQQGIIRIGDGGGLIFHVMGTLVAASGSLLTMRRDFRVQVEATGTRRITGITLGIVLKLHRTATRFSQSNQMVKPLV